MSNFSIFFFFIVFIAIPPIYFFLNDFLPCVTLLDALKFFPLLLLISLFIIPLYHVWRQLFFPSNDNYLLVTCPTKTDPVVKLVLVYIIGLRKGKIHTTKEIQN